MPGRAFSPAGYRYGFDGQENDNDIAQVNGANTTAEYWEYDSRLGRRWNIDPVVKPWESSYATFSNNPTVFVDPNGADADPASGSSASKGDGTAGGSDKSGGDGQAKSSDGNDKKGKYPPAKELEKEVNRKFKEAQRAARKSKSLQGYIDKHNRLIPKTVFDHEQKLVNKYNSDPQKNSDLKWHVDYLSKLSDDLNHEFKEDLSIISNNLNTIQQAYLLPKSDQEIVHVNYGEDKVQSMTVNTVNSNIGRDERFDISKNGEQIYSTGKINQITQSFQVMNGDDIKIALTRNQPNWGRAMMPTLNDFIIQPNGNLFGLRITPSVNYQISIMYKPWQ